MTGTERQFPILSPIAGFPRSVPWSFVKKFENQADRNHSQSLETLARRGGLSWVELFYVVKCKPFPFGLGFEGKFDTVKCAREVLAQIEQSGADG